MKYNSKIANIDGVKCFVDIADVTHRSPCAQEVILCAMQTDYFSFRYSYFSLVFPVEGAMSLARPPFIFIYFIFKIIVYVFKEDVQMSLLLWQYSEGRKPNP